MEADFSKNLSTHDFLEIDNIFSQGVNDCGQRNTSGVAKPLMHVGDDCLNKLLYLWINVPVMI